MATTAAEENTQVNHITEEDIKLILAHYNRGNEEIVIEDYSVHNASDKMLGFLAEYWKVKVLLSSQKVLHFFIKAISRSNAAKASMIKEMRLYDKEAFFYSVIKENIEVPGIKPWAARLITALNDAMVFEDLNAKQYKLRNKFARFDMAHTLQALNTLARCHACSIIYEEKKTKENGTKYSINDDYEKSLDNGGYNLSSEWFYQCMIGALETMKSLSDFNEADINLIESCWQDVWSTALSLGNYSSHQKNVICHGDLWNNNIMFHYKDDKNLLEPDDCVLVDFQAIRYQPPAGDVMLLLCCNLDPKFREENLDTFLNFYYEELGKILDDYNVKIEEVMSKPEFMTSAEEQRQWGLIVCACLIPQFWIDDDLTTKIFCDNKQFDENLSKNKGLFIKKMMQENSDYRQKVMEIFNEVADRYCLHRK
ncbi:unnamed protein product [Spodoptera littoralis]|uniref:CHK kinase-like domain-containing protein n=1 Tax=Spodoptera littoralis TaxID=7109 RepID=A0A9P0I1V6_SPOLI|nr:unnamed protein product [Spodoptera littoralis]CAH1638188.1 unnamed protein product [Spodoptera littoralis]